MTVSQIQFKNQDENLLGVFQMPKGEGPFPAVLFLHGFLSNKCEAHRVFVKIGRLLESQGIASMRFDFRGCGESDGDSKQVTLTSQLSDAKMALDYLLHHPKIDAGRIAILGMSLGGAIASLLAEQDSRIKALLLCSAVAHLPECIELKLADQEPKIDIATASEVDSSGQWVGQSFFKEAAQYDPVKALGSFQHPVLIVHGTEDSTAPLQQSEQYEKMISGKNPHNQRLLIEGADHQFSSAPWQEELMQATVNFLQKIWS